MPLLLASMMRFVGTPCMSMVARKIASLIVLFTTHEVIGAIVWCVLPPMPIPLMAHLEGGLAAKLANCP